MTDEGLGSDVGAEPPASSVVEVDTPTREHRRRRAALRRWGGITLLVVAVLFPVGLIMSQPQVYERPVGLMQEVTAAVTGVRLSEDQPRRRSSTAWDVELTWTDERGQPASGKGRVVERTSAPKVGDHLPIAVTATGDISFETKQAAGALLLATVGFSLFCVGVAVHYLLSARRLSQQPTRLSLTQAVPVIVARRTDLSVRWRSGWGRRRYALDYRAEQPGARGGTFFVERRPDDRLPEIDDHLQVWTDGADGRGPFVVRRPGDDLWWLGGGPDPVPAVQAVRRRFRTGGTGASGPT